MFKIIDDVKNEPTLKEAQKFGFLNLVRDPWPGGPGGES